MFAIQGQSHARTQCCSGDLTRFTRIARTTILLPPPSRRFMRSVGYGLSVILSVSWINCKAISDFIGPTNGKN